MKKCMLIENPNSGDGKNDEFMEKLIENTVIVLDPNGKELFGRAWNKVNGNDDDVLNYHEKK